MLIGILDMAPEVEQQNWHKFNTIWTFVVKYYDANSSFLWYRIQFEQVFPIRCSYVHGFQEIEAQKEPEIAGSNIL